MAETERSGEPTTEAGRRLLAQENIGDGTGWVELPYDEIRDAILAIEAEVRANPPDTDPPKGFVGNEMVGGTLMPRNLDQDLRARGLIDPLDTDPSGLGDAEAAWEALRVEYGGPGSRAILARHRPIIEAALAARSEGMTEDRLAAVLRGTNLVPFDDAGEWAATLMKRMESDG